ncbi:MAG: DUF4199 domain-containing protein [Fimbriimonadaceae bacterium]|nr:DUF4199 domain-containing protein [Chitinophagales bacterium]
MEERIDNIQEFQGTPASKIIRQNAIALSAIFIIILVVTHFFQEQLLDASRYFWIGFMLIMFVFIIFTQNQVKEKSNGGIISFGDAFMTGFKVSLWVAIIYAIFNLIFYILIFPNAHEDMLRLAEQSMREQALPEDQIEMGLKVTRWMVSPLGIFISTMVIYPIMGAINSLIAAAFTQRAKR